MAQQPIIIPIAGGKGGVGKTFLTANLAVALARRNRPTIAVDLDLGNSNLHSFLGLENRYAGVGEFLQTKGQSGLSDLIVETEVPGLGFIAGDGRMPFMANIQAAQKNKLKKALKLLPAHYVLLDLSAGTSFNTLDLFLESDSGILVTTPEYPAVMNMLQFIKNATLRQISEDLKGEISKKELESLYKRGIKDPVFTVEGLWRELSPTHPEAAAKIAEITKRLRPRIVYNMLEKAQDTEIFPRVEQTLSEYLSMECDHFGVIPYDAAVREMLRQPGVFLSQNPSSLTARTIYGIADRVIDYWDMPIEGSAEGLTEYTKKVLAAATNPPDGVNRNQP